MATNEYKLPYRNTSRDGRIFLLNGRDGLRDYTQRSYLNKQLAETINEKDELLEITAKEYPFTTDDLGRMIYHLLSNKVMPSARQIEADKLYCYIRRAFMDALL